jgi:hypothetical protein
MNSFLLLSKLGVLLGVALEFDFDRGGFFEDNEHRTISFGASPCGFQEFFSGF